LTLVAEDNKLCILGPGELIAERSRLYAASALVSLARSILWIAHYLFRVGLLDIAGVKYAIRTSEKLRRLGWRLARWKRARK
jgi:hypothetical protein